MYKLLIKQREEIMNTINVVMNGNTVTYTETEVVNFIADNVRMNETITKDMEGWNKVHATKRKVRDFFSEGKWDGETFIATRNEINDLLESIECDKLRRDYKATVRITAYVTGFTAEDDDEAAECIADEIDVSISGGTISVDKIEVDDVEEDE